MDKFDDAYRQKVAAVVRGVLAAKYAKDDNVPIKIEEVLLLRPFSLLVIWWCYTIFWFEKEKRRPCNLDKGYKNCYEAL